MNAQSTSTPYQLRFDIFQVARQHLLEKYMIDSRGGEFKNVGKYPTFEDIENLANEIKGFVEKK